MMNVRILLLALAGAAVLAGCSSGPEKPKPSQLEVLSSPVSFQPVWSVRVGDAKSLPLRLAVAGGVVVSAAVDGSVQAIDLANGQVRWRGEAGAKLSAAVGSDGRYASVVTQDNELVTLDQGKPLWRLPLVSKVVTPPLVAGERVFVQSVDRSVQAFDVLDGRKLWIYHRPSDPLALAQPGVLAPVRNTLWAGVGPRLSGLEPVRGQLRQDVIVASPRGGNEVERLADLVGPAARKDDILCARAFQTAVGCIDTARGTVLWSKPQSGFEGVAMDDAIVVGADASDRVVTWRRSNGEVFWRAEQFLYRKLSAPAIVGRFIAFGDAEGYIHLIARTDGRTAGRLQTDGSGIASPLMAVQGTLLAVTRGGTVYAYRPE